MSHARLTILEELASTIAIATGAAVFLEDETANQLPCVQVAPSSESLGKDSAKAVWERQLTVRVTVRAVTIAEREELTEQLELALLADGALGAFEVTLAGVEMSRVGGDGGQRHVASTYTFSVSYWTPREDPSEMVEP